MTRSERRQIERQARVNRATIQINMVEIESRVSAANVARHNGATVTEHTPAGNRREHTGGQSRTSIALIESRSELACLPLTVALRRTGKDYRETAATDLVRDIAADGVGLSVADQHKVIAALPKREDCL